MTSKVKKQVNTKDIILIGRAELYCNRRIEKEKKKTPAQPSK